MARAMSPLLHEWGYMYLLPLYRRPCVWLRTTDTEISALWAHVLRDWLTYILDAIGLRFFESIIFVIEKIVRITCR